MASETALTLLNRCDVLIENADAFFREFWRIALSEALLKVPDYEKITTKIAEQRTVVTALRQSLVNSPDDESAVRNALTVARKIEAGLDPLQTSLGHSLASLKHAVDLSQTLPKHERLERLRVAVANIKQWKDV